MSSGRAAIRTIADDIGAVLSWRIENHLATLIETGAIPPEPEPGLGISRFDWVADRTLETSPDVPDNWKIALATRADYILNQRMPERGAKLAIEQPAWTTQLGDLPADPDRLISWMELAAEIDLFRSKYNVAPDEPTAVPAELRGSPLGQNFATRTVALHKGTAIRHAAGNTATTSPEQLLPFASKLAAVTDATRPRADAEKVAHTLDPDRVSRLDQKLSELAKAVERATGKPVSDATPKASTGGDSAIDALEARVKAMAAARQKRTPVVDDAPAYTRSTDEPSIPLTRGPQLH